MKREGRQHGMVRTYQVRPPEFYRGPSPRYNRSDSPSTAGLFTKVSSKPTNHSKYTSKCRKPICNCCHNLPVCKSKTKSKGTQKLRLGDAQPQGLNLCGLSATLILDHLTTDSNYYYFSLEEENDDHVEEEEEDEEVTNLTAAHSDHVEVEEEKEGEVTNLTAAHSDHVEVEEEEKEGEVTNLTATHSDHHVGSDEKNNNDNENMNFCDVGYDWEHVEDDGDWCLVIESMD